MAFSKEYAEHILDLLEPLGTISIKRMFGGGGVYWGASMFALIADEVLYLKVDDETKAAFLDAGCEPFTYEKSGKPVALSYLTVPDDAAEDIDALRPWAHMALAAANRAQAKKKPRKS